MLFVMVEKYLVREKHEAAKPASGGHTSGTTDRRTLMKTTLLPLLVATLLTGCSVGPDFTKPESAAPAEWQTRDTVLTLDSTAMAAADTGWWQMFGDTVLTSLIHSALKENNDVRIAAARVEEYMGLYGVSKSDFFPKIGATGSALRGQSMLSGDGTNVRPTQNVFDVNVSATWEIDLWGKIRRATEAARANLLAAEEARRGVVLSIVALVADSYIDLLSLDKQLVDHPLHGRAPQESARPVPATVREG